MKLSRVLLAAVISAVVALSLCANAGAANVVVGPSLTGTWEPEECVVEACTFINAGPGTPEVSVRSPVDGAIVRWSVIGGSTAGTYRLGTTLQFGKKGFTFRKWDEPVSSSLTANVQSFSTVLPVEKGMSIALTMSEGASLGFREGVGQLVGWGFEPLESENPGEGESELFPEELAGFNAEIQPAPTIASLGTTSGPTTGGTSVTITGTDLENATGVTFGSTPATSFTADSESQLTAVAPANTSAASVSVTVTTIAGRANAPQNFTYAVPPVATTPPPPPSHCVVPKLTGKKLAAAKKALATAKCKLGAVKTLGGATVKSGKVSKQGAKPGTKLAVGAKVAVTLKASKPAGKRAARSSRCPMVHCEFYRPAAG